MSIMRQNKQWAGNVCLVVFMALLFSMVFGTIGVGAANAAVGADDITVNSSASTSVAVPYGDSSVEIKLSAVTSDEFTPLWFQAKVDSAVYQQAYLSTVGTTAYNSSLGVYELVYTFTYGALFDARTPFDLVFLDDAGTIKSVSLTFEGPPPEDDNGGGGGGGGGGTTTPPPASTTEPIQAQPTVSGNTATAEVTAAQVTTQAQSASVATVTITVSEVANASEVKVALPAAAITAVTENKKNLEIQTQVATIALPPAVLLAPAVQNLLTTGAKLEVAAKVVPAAEATSALQVKAPESVAAGSVVELTLSVVQASGSSEKVTSFAAKVWVTLPYDAGKLGNVDPAKLGVYRFNETTKQWDFVGGKVNAATGTVQVGLGHFSLYTVMAYDKTFADVAKHWAKADIELMAARHVAQGVDDKNFQPERTITRAEFAALVLRSLGLDEVKPAVSTFGDLNTGQWYYGAAETARKYGLVVGYEDNTFRPDASISREEMAAMVTRALKATGSEVAVSDAEASQLLAAYADKGSISGWARTATAAAVKSGIIKGRTSTTFVPSANATRAESVTMLKRMLSTAGEI